jgi:hypothetical protein
MSGLVPPSAASRGPRVTSSNTRVKRPGQLTQRERALRKRRSTGRKSSKQSTPASAAGGNRPFFVRKN